MPSGMHHPVHESAALPAESRARSLSLQLEQRALDLELKSAALDGLSDGILVHTFEGSLLYFNPAAATLYGHTQDEFARLGKYGWVPPSARAVIQDRVASLKANRVLDFQSQGRTSEGELIATEVHSSVVTLPRFGDVLVSVIQNITARLAADEIVKHLAFHDTLTGLANRVMLDERLRLALSEADRYGDTLGIVYLDLDEFKPINDQFGHAFGDTVLKTVAERLTRCVRECDTVARMGGDEFLVIFPRLNSRDELARLGRKVYECIAQPIEIDERTVQVSTKIGLATYHTGEAPDELISRADHAMYRARARQVEGWDEFSAED